MTGRNTGVEVLIAPADPPEFQERTCCCDRLRGGAYLSLEDDACVRGRSSSVEILGIDLLLARVVAHRGLVASAAGQVRRVRAQPRIPSLVGQALRGLGPIRGRGVLRVSSEREMSRSLDVVWLGACESSVRCSTLCGRRDVDHRGGEERMAEPNTPVTGPAWAPHRRRMRRVTGTRGGPLSLRACRESKVQKHRPGRRREPQDTIRSESHHVPLGSLPVPRLPGPTASVPRSISSA